MAAEFRTHPKKAYSALLKQIFTNLGDPTAYEHVRSQPHVYLPAEGRAQLRQGNTIIAESSLDSSDASPKKSTVLVISDGVNAYFQLIGLLETTSGIGNFVGNDYIAQTIQEYLQLNASQPPMDDLAWEAATQSMLKSLRNLETSHEVFLPVQNLRIEEDFTLGGVRFRRPEFINQELRQPIFGIIDGKENPLERKVQYAAMLDAAIFRPLTSAGSCASTTTICHQSKLFELSVSKIRQGVNLIRCFSSILYDESLRAQIGVFTEATTGAIPLLSTNADRSAFSATEQTVGFLFPFDLSSSMLQFLREHGCLNTLSDILEKANESRTELEDAIATAIHWIGIGCFGGSKSERVMALATALEALLIEGNNFDKSEPLGERIAFFLGQSADDRKEIHRHVKRDLYDLRSKIVHEGYTNVPQNVLSDFCYYATAVLVEVTKGMVAHHWSKVSDLASVVSDAKFAVNAYPIPKLIPRAPLVTPYTIRMETGNPVRSAVVKP